ncbi:MAG TPA: hypothetical protein VLD67_20500 [Vicinamibacterales bacterium]|nr:hypothetical protein [Vicinamibacterales bacterium]
MRLLYSSALLGLAWFAAINLIASGAAWAASRVLLGRGRMRTPSALAVLRIAPAVVSGIVVAAIFLPAHWLVEPDVTDESFGVVIAALAASGGLLLLRSASRTVSVVAATRSLGRAVKAASGDGSPAFHVLPGVTGVSLAGVVRPQVLVGPEVPSALTADELQAAIDHEAAHRRWRDNLTRCLMYCAPDVFGWSAAARQVEDTWRAEAEYRADAEAAAGDESRAIHLASALVKVARLNERAAGSRTFPVWSTFNEARLLEARVRLLLVGPRPIVARARRTAGVFVAALACGGAAAWVSGAPYLLHEATEALIAILP